MNLRRRLTVISSLVFGIIFACCSLIIYTLFYQTSQHALYKDLQQTTLLTAIYYLEKDEQPQQQHQLVKAQFDELLQSTQVAIFNQLNQIEYGDLKSETALLASYIAKVKKQGKLFFKGEDSFYFGLFYKDNQGDFVVFIKKDSQLFQSQMELLLAILIIVLLVGWISIIVLSKYLTSIAYKPLRRIIAEVSNKDLSKLQEPIAIAKAEDELQELLITYNKLLARVADTFSIQHNFVNYVSHEFRTPLAAIRGQMEVFSQKDRSPAEYQEVTLSVLAHIDFLTQIINNMLLLAGSNKPQEPLQTVRVDELLWDCMDRCQQLFQATFTVDFPPLPPTLLLLKALESTMQLACYNMVENAVKYSDNRPIHIQFERVAEQLKVSIYDQGIGIAADELPYVTDTFYRGKQARQFKGSGIGLSLTKNVCKQYDIQLLIKDKATERAAGNNTFKGTGTVVELLFPIYSK